MIDHSSRVERRKPHHERRETLLARLAEAEDTLRALRNGEVDALVVRGTDGDQVYTLHSAEEYRNLLEQMPEGALVLAPSGDILYSNARFADLVGQPLESVLGENIGRFITNADRVALNALLGSGNGTCRSRLISSAGRAIEVYLSLATTMSKGIGALGLIVTDISALVEARHDRDRAERDSRTKSEFLAMLAHELRNPLGAIGAAVAVLECVDLQNEPASRARAAIGRQVRHLSHLIDDLLDVERVVSGKIRLDRHPLDLVETVRSAVAGFTGSNGLVWDVAIGAEPVWVEGDAVRLEQILVNVLTNAVKYTPEGGHVHVSLGGDGNDAVLSVRDTGFGIAPELLPTIFDMFVQGDRTLDRAQGGLGLGLTLVRRLVELHGGTVVASSGGVGQGSTFTVRLPQIPSIPSRAGVPGLLQRPVPRRVLLIEDNRDAREMFRMVLELAGHTVYEAENGRRGLELLQTKHPEVAVIDIGLPGLDGYEVARRIRDLPDGPAMLLLALTGYDTPGHLERSAEAGFDHHLVKPVDLDEFARLLGRPGSNPPRSAALMSGSLRPTSVLPMCNWRQARTATGGTLVPGGND
jgi:two-component system, sensor histidine kinase